MKKDCKFCKEGYCMYVEDVCDIVNRDLEFKCIHGDFPHDEEYCDGYEMSQRSQGDESNYMEVPYGTDQQQS